MSKPSLYSTILADLICEQIADGMSLRQLCVTADMPNRRTVFRWLNEHPDFATRYGRAREAQGDLMDERILEEAEKTTAENAHAQRVKIDAYKWRAAKLAPKRYGDRIDVTSGGDKLDTSGSLSLQDAARLAAILAEAEKRKNAGGS
jgi:hypothetical protein